MDLRKEIIRLAHENPELREHLLPLLKEGQFPTAEEPSDEVALAASMTRIRAAAMLLEAEIGLMHAGAPVRGLKGADEKTLQLFKDKIYIWLQMSPFARENPRVKMGAKALFRKLLITTDRSD